MAQGTQNQNPPLEGKAPIPGWPGPPDPDLSKNMIGTGKGKEHYEPTTFGLFLAGATI